MERDGRLTSRLVSHLLHYKHSSSPGRSSSFAFLFTDLPSTSSSSSSALSLSLLLFISCFLLYSTLSRFFPHLFLFRLHLSLPLIHLHLVSSVRPHSEPQACPHADILSLSLSLSLTHTHTHIAPLLQGQIINLFKLAIKKNVVAGYSNNVYDSLCYFLSLAVTDTIYSSI